MANAKNNNKEGRSLWLATVHGVGRIKLYAIGAIVVLVIVASAYLVRQCRGNSITAHVNDSIDITPTQVLAMEEIGEWEFLSIEDEEMVDTVRKKLFGTDELIRIYRGTLRLGIDLSEAREDWVAVSGDTLRIVLPKVTDWDAHVFHIFSIRTKHRDELQKYLTENGIQTVIHYPIPPHKQECYREWNNLSFPITEKIHDEELSLPMSPVMTEEEMKSVADVLDAWVA